jgi:hypothetical protein
MVANPEIQRTIEIVGTKEGKACIRNPRICSQA